ncbi:hypothetical protein GCM10010466_58460 [Planomonospora alba]|uniref:Helicase XPB/Ssl2 N-terminal domain-containing protein n=1 Tax=Planomonospora alba TaxID=161354 RepID=A0ABP6NWF2_9ACTN
MRTYFDPEEAEEYEAAMDVLVRRCVAWAGERGLEADGLVLSAALEARHVSVDGRLGHWTPQEVRRVLLEWIPRQVTAVPGELDTAPQSLLTLLRYLDACGLRDPRGATMAELERAVAETAAEYPAAMADPTRWGIAKFWAMTALEHGVDLTDGTAFARFRRDLDAGRVDYDQRVLDQLLQRRLTEPDLGGERAFPQPPVRLPPGTELAEAASGSAVLSRLAALVGWVGADGRALTAAGNLRLQDARELAELLGTGEQDLKVRTAAEMTGLGLLLAWVKKARLVRVSKGRLVRVAKAAPLLRDPLALWHRAFEAFLGLGEAVCAPAGRWTPASLLAADFDELLPDALNSVYGMPHPMPMARLTETMWYACTEYHWDLSGEGDPVDGGWRERFDREVERAFAVLAELGAVELSHGVADELYSTDLHALRAAEGRPPSAYDGGPDGSGDRDLPDLPFPPQVRERLLARLAEPGTLVRLTPLGVSAVRERMLAQGRDAPLLGELAGAAPAEMLGVVAQHYPPEEAGAEVQGWLAAHGGDVEPLLQAVRDCPFRTRAAALLGTLVTCLDDGPALLERLRRDPVLGPIAVAALIEDGTLHPEKLTERESALMLAEGMLGLLELGGPEAVREQIASLAGPGAELTELVLGSGHPDETGLEEFRTLVALPLRSRGRPLRLVRSPAPGSRGRPTGHGRRRRR